MLLKSNLDFNHREAIELVLHNSVTDPVGGQKGQVYFNSALTGGDMNTVKYFDSLTWQVLASKSWVTANFGTSFYEGWFINKADSATGAFNVLSGKKIVLSGGLGISIETPAATWGDYWLKVQHDSFPFSPPAANATHAITSISVTNGHLTAQTRSVFVKPLGTIHAGRIASWSGASWELISYYDVWSNVVDEIDLNKKLVRADAMKEYIANRVYQLNGKGSVSVSTATSLSNVVSITASTITFSAAVTVIDGVTLTNGMRILVRNETGTKEHGNGIYIRQSATVWVRSADADTWDELVSAYVFSESGTVNADVGWYCTVDSGGVLGTTAVTFVKFFHFGVTTGSNLGAGVNVYHSTNPSNVLNFRSINANSSKIAVVLGGTSNYEVRIDAIEANFVLGNIGGVLPVAKGGTNISTYAKGDTLWGNATNGLGKLPVGVNGSILAADSTQALGVKWLASGQTSFIEQINSSLFRVTEANSVVDLDPYSVYTLSRLYRSGTGTTNNPTVTGTRLKYGGSFLAYDLTAWNKLRVKTVDNIPPLGMTGDNSYFFTGRTPDAGHPFELTKMSFSNFLSTFSLGEHYVQDDLTGSVGTILKSTHECGVNPVISVRERSGTSPNFIYREVLCNLTVNNFGDITWSVDDAFTVSNPGQIIVQGSKSPR